MISVIEFLWNFFWIFLLVLIIYLVFINRRKRVYSRLKKGDPVKLFIARYNIDVRKVNYRKILNTTAVINSFIISFTSTLTMYVHGIFWSILVCFACVFGLIYALYELAGRYFKKMEAKSNV